jgi:amidohydrolase
VLAGRRTRLPGTVEFVFQPAEDSRPDGETGGASEMIRAGVLDQPKVDVIFGLHVGPLPHGTIAYRPQGAMAGVSVFTISVAGRQTHGALPWTGVDPIPVAAEIVQALQLIVSREIDGRQPRVLTIGRIQGGTRFNIVADKVTMDGTMRTHDTTVRAEMKARMARTVKGVADVKSTLQIQQH